MKTTGKIEIQDKFERKLKLRIRQVIAVLIRLFICFPVALFLTKSESPQSMDVMAIGNIVDQYWAQTDLKLTAVEPLLSDDQCFKDRLAFLTCVRVVSVMAEKIHLIVTPALNVIEQKHAKGLPVYNEEKAQMEMWSKIFESKNFVPAQQFLNILGIVRNRIAFSQRGFEAAVASLGLNSFLSMQKDPHTYLLPMKYYEQVVAKQEMTQSPFGVQVRRFGKDAFVRKVLPGSPAELAGVQRGDRIVSVNRKFVSAIGPTYAQDLVRSLAIDKLEISVQRGSKVFDLIMNKNMKVYESVYVNRLDRDKSVLVISLHRFAVGTCQMTKSLMLKEQAKRDFTAVVLDLRDNPGGQVSEASCIINLFVAKNRKLFEVRFLDAKRKPEAYIALDKPLFNGPLAVLINSGSASASEIVAGSLKDLGRGKIIGETSFGKGSFQDGATWGANEKIALFETQGLYFFPSGWTAQVQGVVPDVVVKMDPQPVREKDLYMRPISPTLFVDQNLKNNLHLMAQGRNVDTSGVVSSPLTAALAKISALAYQQKIGILQKPPKENSPPESSGFGDFSDVSFLTDTCDEITDLWSGSASRESEVFGQEMWQSGGSSAGSNEIADTANSDRQLWSAQRILSCTLSARSGQSVR